MAARLRIPARFNGPPGSGQGGCTAGLLARAAGRPRGPLAVSLRMPPPLERDLAVVTGEDGSARLLDGDVLVAEAAPADVDVEPPAPPTPDEARDARPSYGGLDEHPYPTCFVCGPAREDGLGLFAGPLQERPDVWAAAWTPEDADPLWGWAALDCPTGHACALPRPALLARFAVRVDADLRPGEPHVVTAWAVSAEGRKHVSAGALHAADGALVAVSEALWIEPR